MLSRRDLTVAILCGTALMGAGAAERTFYKSVLSNGHPVYSDAPVAGASRVEKINVQTGPPTSDAVVESAKRTLAQSDQELLKDSEARTARQAQTTGQIAVAYEKHRAAKAEVEAGRPIQEGDRQGRRLTPTYWDRQLRLAAAAAQARDELEAAISKREALR